MLRCIILMFIALTAFSCNPTPESETPLDHMELRALSDTLWLNQKPVKLLRYNTKGGWDFQVYGVTYKKSRDGARNDTTIFLMPVSPAQAGAPCCSIVVDWTYSWNGIGWYPEEYNEFKTYPAEYPE